MTTKTTLIDFSWPSDGAKSVQISGDWNQWATKEDLEIKEDGGFHKMIALPENSKVLYKFIVDGSWLTKDSLPTETDSSNNVNNVVHVGPAPIPAEEKKEEAAVPLKESAGQDIKNKIPDSVSQATHSAAPALAGIGGAMGAAVASVTGIDPSLGNPKEVESKGVSDAPATTRNVPSHEELSEIGLNKSPALAGATAISGAAFAAQSAVAPGSTATEPIPSKDISTTQLPSALNPSSTEAGAILAKLGSPIPESNQDPAPSSSTATTTAIAAPTESEIKNAMANPAAAAAGTPANGIPGKTSEPSVPPAASAPQEIPVVSVPQTGNTPSSKVPTSIPPSASASTPAAQSGATSNATTSPPHPQPVLASSTPSQPDVPVKDDLAKSKSVKKAKSNKKLSASASASAAPAIDSTKTLPTTPQTPEKSSSKIKDGSQTVKEKRGSKFGTLGSSSKRKSNNDLATFAKSQSSNAPTSQDPASGKLSDSVAENGNGRITGEAPSTPNKNRDRKVSLFGKIKHALSPNSSPSK